MLHERLRCYRMAVCMAEELSKEVAGWPRGLGYLKDQQRRAMASVVLNLSEGNARMSRKERRRFFEIARASTSEVSSCIDLGQAFGLIPAAAAMPLKSRLTDISKTRLPRQHDSDAGLRGGQVIWGLMR